MAIFIVWPLFFCDICIEEDSFILFTFLPYQGMIYLYLFMNYYFYSSCLILFRGDYFYF